ncbi:coiled-coil domain-containing protein 172 isoform X1 [Canis lupus familiaris]|uniref:coiled-coil domain-containing protein 172 isoform X1 n=1 Tax=Canis lupus familiaris TaxID=9615 RepID=UPI0018F7738E|nr:coiled-coil domain-containing protein 172 isoform X1 [Canis lupus familiaris]XP_038434825.1 coiled-coil domain-containing protein 172 isoform X1 [Canis lupus familiaris]
MSLESLFQHIIFSEHQAEESRRLIREVRSEINRCREEIKKATELLNEEKIKLELKEAAKKKVTEEEEKFIKEITDFNNEYEVTKKRELWIKENVKIEISDLENQTNILKREMKSMEHDSGQLSELQKQKSELEQELLTVQRKLKDCKHFLNCLVFEDKKNEAICTTKYLEAEKVKINEKPQSDAECLRLKKELQLYKEDDMQSACEALQTEIEILELTLAQKDLQENK